MKKFSAGVVLGFLVSWGMVFAEPNFNHNGIFWTRLNNTAKTGYINGYGDAMQVSVGKLESLSIAADLFHWKGADKIIRQLADELSTSELTPAEAVHKLDTLYANPKYSELDLGQALQLLTVKAPPDDPAAANAPAHK
ncbi:MAG TPA: hypothetical protein VKS22_16685 [Candidatus Binataceae bacterium]|nr:hypothetical protein [Candidatus Binataceae bacterium]